MSPAFASWLAQLLTRSRKASVSASMRQEWVIPGHLDTESVVDQELERMNCFRCYSCGVSFFGQPVAHAVWATAAGPVCKSCADDLTLGRQSW